MQFDLPKDRAHEIKVIGIGGGGGNAVQHMFNQGIEGVNFAICNTDEQAMETNSVPNRIALGPSRTEGRGAGSKPEVGREATEESIDEVKELLSHNTRMVFITAGMGGGTGTGGAPVVARVARELGILTVGIVTMPFAFEGPRRLRQAEAGLEELSRHVDSLIVISNDRVLEAFPNQKFRQAFSHADNVLATAAKGIAEIITVPGYVNVDFEDVRTVMQDSGVAIMGSYAAEGEHRALRAVEGALSSPLLNERHILGAKHILLNISSSSDEDMGMDEVMEITSYVQQQAGSETDVIWGNCYDDSLGDKICVTVIATGFAREEGGLTEQSNERIVRDLNGQDEEATNDPRQITFDFNQRKNGNNGQSPAASARPQHHEPTLKRTPDRDESPEQSNEVEERKLLLERDRDRVRRLKAFNRTMVDSEDELREMEREPAYRRRDKELDNVPHSSEKNVSRHTLHENEDGTTEIRKNNRYLHDNID